VNKEKYVLDKEPVNPTSLHSYKYERKILNNNYKQAICFCLKKNQNKKYWFSDIIVLSFVVGTDF
jgi:hypothetical protein